jgi:hypothetical protein
MEMNGFIGRLVLVTCLGGGVASLGCVRYRDLVDPCWPERYEYAARQEVYNATAPQVRNGHVLDQTVWNYHFEKDETTGLGSDRLTPAGMQHLRYLSRRRPSPDGVVFLQTAYDLAYDPTNPDAFAQRRTELDRSREVAIKRFLSAQTAGRPVPFEVVVHDPGEVGLPGVAGGREVVPPGGYYGAFGAAAASPAGLMPIGGVFGAASAGGAR